MPSTAATHVEINSVESPDGSVILIIDGLGSSYIYPEIISEKTDGTKIETSEYDNFSLIFDKSTRVLNVSSREMEQEANSFNCSL